MRVWVLGFHAHFGIESNISKPPTKLLNGIIEVSTVEDKN